MSVRVLHVVKVAGISGAENHLLLLLPALRERGFDVAATMLHEGEPGAEEFAARLGECGVPVECIRLGRATDPLSFSRILRTIRRTRPEIVHTHLVHADFHALPAARLARVPVVVSTKHGFNAFRDGRAFAAADRAVAALADVRYLGESEGFDPASFEIVHYGIEPGPEPPPLPGAPRLAIVGRLVPIKGHDVLFRAVAAAREQVPGMTLEVAGDGPLEVELRASVARLGLEDVVSFLGRVSPVAPVLERAQVVVVPSFGEGFGMVALEAIERGRPVVASDVGGLPEIVDGGRTGLLVPAGDAASLAEALVDLASDPGRAAAFGAAARVRALEVFSQDRCTDRIEALYGTALAAAGDRRRRRSAQARSSANAASSASTKSHGAR
jgi:glycosyltransferase involved in cell wall biosynthesis